MCFACEFFMCILVRTVLNGLAMLCKRAYKVCSYQSADVSRSFGDSDGGTVLGHVVMPRLVHYGHLDVSRGREVRKTYDKIR